MNLKKLLLFVMLAFMSLSSINALTELTSCGKSSGWTSGETYLIDFELISSSYSGSYCFDFSGQTYSDIIFTTNNKTLVNEKSGLEFFTMGSGLSLSGFEFNDFKYYSDSVTDTFIRIIGISNSRAYNFQFNNFEVIGPNYFYRGSASGVNSAYSMENTIFTNAYFDVDYMWYNQCGYDSGFQNSEWHNSYINPRIAFSNQGAQSSCRSFGNTFYNSYLTDNTNLFFDSTYTNTLSESIFKGHTYLDVNDNNIGDGTTTFGVYEVNPAIVIQAVGFNFFQDLEEGEELYDDYADNDLNNIYLSDEILSSSHIGSYYTNANGGLNDFEGTLIIEDMLKFILNGGINCNAFDNEYCLIQDGASYTATKTDTYRGLLSTGTNAVIEYITINKVGSNNAQMISNFADTYNNNMTIRNNIFNKADNRANDGNNHLIYLKSNNLNINNNFFNVTYDSDKTYEMIDVVSTTPNTNKITENIFEQHYDFSAYTQEIFDTNADTTFYNNDLGTGFVVSTSAKSNLNVNPSPYIIYNNQVYYFDIGNYYVDNTGCVDGDGDGICDSPYTSGAIVDDYPLASYPYVYLSHLSDASSTIAIGDFNITLNLLNNQTFEFETLIGETINISFMENSDFGDLTCNYFIDGGSIYIKNDPIKDEWNNILIGTLENKTYSYRVECYNDFVSGASDEITFNVFHNPSAVIPDDDVNATTSDGEVTGGVEDLFSTDISTSSDSIQSLYSLMSTPLNWGILIGIVLIGLAMLGLIFAVVGVLLK